MNGRPLRIGFAGANADRGWAQLAHMPAIGSLPGLKIHAVLSRTEQAAASAAAAFGAAKAVTDAAALVNDPEIDIIAVTVKVPEHRALVLAALAAGKHVYCEWPLGRDVTEAEEMAAAARKAPAHVVIGTQGPFAPALRHAASLVRKGAIGRPLNLRMVSPSAGWGTRILPGYAYLEDPRNGATLSTIPGGHSIAAVEAVIGAYEEIDARNSTLRRDVRVAGNDVLVPMICTDHVLVIGRHASGCVSSLEVVGGTIDTRFRFELRGEKGTLEITGTHPGGYQCSVLSVVTNPISEPQPAPVAPGLKDDPANVAELWAAFEADIRSGTRSVPDFDFAVRLSRTLAAIDAAAATGPRVTLRE